MRLRITFSKSGALRYTGHLDLHTIWERTIRRAGLPLAYTQGFHPGPKIQLASALPLGFIGRNELVDVWLSDPASPEMSPGAGDYIVLLQPAAPPGLLISSVEVVDDHAPALQTQVISVEYEVALLEPWNASDLGDRLSVLLGTATLPRERRGKTYDLRPLIESLELRPVESPGEFHLQMRLSSRAGATGRPEEVLDALGISFEATRIERTRLIFK